MKNFKNILSLVLAFAVMATVTPATLTSYADGAELAEDSPILTAGDDFVAHEVLASADSQEQAEEIAKAYKLKLKSYSWGVAVFEAADPEQEVDDSEGQSEIMSDGEDLPELSLNYIYTISAIDETEYTYIDSDTSSNASISATSNQWHHAEINTEQAWTRSTGTGVTVAVIDTGIDTSHSSFSGRITASSYNSDTDKIGTSYVNDSNGHGTHVAGIIAASNGSQVAGVAPDAKIMVIKASVANSGTFSTVSLARGINYAVENGADIINMSLGRSYSQGEDSLEQEAVINAVNNGVTIIAAAGNAKNGNADYPAAYPQVIAVSGTKEGGVFDSSYSNYGPEIDIAAPGTAILSTYTSGKYAYMTGTSMASPNVAGVAALIKSKNPDYTPEQIRDALCSNAIDKGSSGWDKYYGYGVVNAGTATGVLSIYTLTFDANGGSVSASSKTVAESSVAGSLPTPTRSRYDFDGWYTAKTGGTKVTESTVIKKSMTVYAKWTAKTYKITYKLNSGKNPSDAKSGYTYGTSYTLPTPTRTGYKFGGWYTEKDFSSGKQTSISKTDYGNLTLYAKWTAKTYSITYKLGSSKAENHANAPTSYTYGKGKSLKKPTRSGYAFVGWYTKSSLSSSSKITSISETKSGNLTLYAKWVKLPAKPTSVKATANTKSKITVTWKKVSGADGYEVYRATSKNGTYKKVKTVSKGSTVKYANKSLTSNKTYYYKVRAYKVVDGKKVYGEYSAVKSAKTKKS